MPLLTYGSESKSSSVVILYSCTLVKGALFKYISRYVKVSALALTGNATVMEDDDTIQDMVYSCLLLLATSLVHKVSSLVPSQALMVRVTLTSEWVGLTIG